MRKPRDEGRSTRSSGTRTRVTAAPKKNTVPKAKPKAKAKPQPKKQGKDVDRPVQVTVIRVRNPKASKNVIQGAVSKQKNQQQQKKKTAAVVGALKDDLLKKLAEKVDDKITGVVNTLLEVSYVTKKVIPRKKKKGEEPAPSSQEKVVKREVSPVKQVVKSKKESHAETKSEIAPSKESDKKSSKDFEKKTTSKDVKKGSTKDEKRTVNKDDKKSDKKALPKVSEKKNVKKPEKKNTGKDSTKQIVKEKKTTRGSKIALPEIKKKPINKTKKETENIKLEKNVAYDTTEKDSENIKKEKDRCKKESESSRKDHDCSKKENEISKKETESSKKDAEISKKDNENFKKEFDESAKNPKKDPEENKKSNDNGKKDLKKDKEIEIIKKVADIKKEIETEIDDSNQSFKTETTKKSKSTKDDDAKKVKMGKEDGSKKSSSTKDDETKISKTIKEEDSKKSKPTKVEELKSSKKTIPKPSVDSKKATESKTSTKKINEKEKSKISTKKETKGSSRPSSKNRENQKEDKKSSPAKKVVKRKPKIECELDGNARISQILNTPKRHREASLNALAKVHCLYENESRGAIMDVIDKSEKLYQEERKLQEERKQEERRLQQERKHLEEKKQQTDKKLQDNKKSLDETRKTLEESHAQKDNSDKSDEVTIKREKESEPEDAEEKREEEKVPVRNLRTAPGLRSVGRHWDIFNASSSSSEDSSDSASERKSVEEPPKSPPKVVEKKVKRRRKRSEVIMDLKDMVVKKRMASLNASAMMAATYSMDKRSNKSDDDSLRKDSDSRESSSSPDVVEVVETSEDEVILSGRKKALVILNQDNSDLTITGVYVNSTTRTRHEGFCSFAGMQYRISSTSHTQTETAVSTETTVHTVTTEHQQQQGESSRSAAGGSDGGSTKAYTPLGALSSMQPPGSPRYPPSPASSAFSAPPHHHSAPPAHPHQDIHETILDHSQGYFQPAGPLISTSQLKAGPSQVEDMQGTSSQAVTYTTYPPPPPSGYLEPPGYPPHAYPKYPPPPPGYSPHRRYYYSPIDPPYPAHYPHPSYYSHYTPPPQPPPHFRPAPYNMENAFHPCPCPMPQTCPKNVHTGPLTGTSKGSESNSTVPPVGASRGPVQLNPVALALPPEPNTAVNPPSPARGSAGLPPPASPALAQASWGTPPPPQSPGLLTAVEPQPRRKRRRTTSISPPPTDRLDKRIDEKDDKLIRPIDRLVLSSDKYERLQNPVDRYTSKDKTLLSDRLNPSSETVIELNSRINDFSETLLQTKPNHNSDALNQPHLFNEKTSDRLAPPIDKIQQCSERTMMEKLSSKCKTPLQTEKACDRSMNLSEKAGHTIAGRHPHPSDVMSHSNDRSVHVSGKTLLLANRPNITNDKDQNSNRLLLSERLLSSAERITQSDRSVQLSVRVSHTADSSEKALTIDRTLHERLPQPDRTKSLNKSVPQERMSRPAERVVPLVNDLQNGQLSPAGDVPFKENSCSTIDEPSRKRSLSQESNDQTSNKRRISVNKRAPRPKNLPSPAEADTPPKRNSKSPENKAVLSKKICVPLKNGRKKKDLPEVNICQEIVETTSFIACPQLKWSNGWSWRGEPFSATVYIRDDRTEVRKCYPAMEHREGDIIHPRDCILLKAGSRKNLPFVAKVAALWENPDDGEMMVSLLWYYRPEHTEQGRQPHQPPDEVFASKHKDSNSVACIEDKCYVLTFNEYCRYMKRCRQQDTNNRGWTPVPTPEGGYPRGSRMPPGRVSRDLIFFCRKVYDFRLSRILKNPC